MPPPLHSSRRRYVEYRSNLKEQRKDKNYAADSANWHSPAPAGRDDPRKKKPRSRPFLKLFTEFWGMLRGHHRTLAVALVALSLSTLLGLVPLYGTK